MQWKSRVLVACLGVFLMSGSLVRESLGQVTMPRLDFRDRTLTNGLRVLSLEDHSSPTVSIQVWYKVGSKDDQKAVAALRIFEHICSRARET